MERATIAIAEILVNLDRQEGGMGELDSLAASMERNGLINPITVVSVYAPGDGIDASDPIRYEIVAGRRRLEAAKSLGWTEIPATILERDEAVEEEVQLAENVNRLDMHPLDEAILYKRLIDAGSPLIEVAQLSGRSKSAVYQRVELLRLVPAIKERFRAGSITMTQASMIGALSVDAQESIDGHLAKEEKRNGGRLYGWEVSNAIRRYGGISLASKSFPLCESCQKRTRYSDESLFPELTAEADRCLDRDCYEKQFKEWVIEQIEAHYVDCKAQISQIKTAPDIIENSELKILYSPGAHLTIEGVKFPVISDKELVVLTDAEMDREGYSRALDRVRDSLKTAFYIRDASSVEIVHYVRRDILYPPVKHDNESRETRAPVVPLNGNKEEKAYQEVIRDKYSIAGQAREFILGNLALERFDTLVAPEIIRTILDDFNNSDLVRVVQLHDKTLEDIEIVEGAKWIEGRSLEWIKTLFFDLLLDKALTELYFDPERPLDEDDAQIISALGEDPEEIRERCFKVYQSEITRRMSLLHNPPSKTQEEGNEEEESESDEEEADEEYSGEDPDEGWYDPIRGEEDEAEPEAEGNETFSESDDTESEAQIEAEERV